MWINKSMNFQSLISNLVFSQNQDSNQEREEDLWPAVFVLFQGFGKNMNLKSHFGEIFLFEFKFCAIFGEFELLSSIPFIILSYCVSFS